MGKPFIFLSVLMCLILYGCDSSERQTDERTVVKRCSVHLPKIKHERRLMINHIDKVRSNSPELNEKLNPIKRKMLDRFTADLSNLCHVVADEWLILEYTWLEIATIVKSNNSGTKVGTDALLGLSNAFDIKEGYVIVIVVKLFKYIKDIFSNSSKSSLENTLINISKDELILEAEHRALYAKNHKERVTEFLESKP